ncbi:MAG TPA: helix-turn-helix transcriptional regulator [Conexibacter sp.]|nr:helix-turn-helix transcriptional regulator [Conexibacter sp.]
MHAPPSHPDVFGRVLRRIRRERDLSQEALARAAGLAPNHVSELERAKRDPRLTTLVQLADALGMPVGELLAAFDRQREQLSDA